MPTETAGTVPSSPAQIPISLERLDTKVKDVLAEVERLDQRLGPVLHRKGDEAPKLEKDEVKAPLSTEIDKVTDNVDNIWSFINRWHQELEV